MTLVRCSQIIRQKSHWVSLSGPCVAMYWFGFSRAPATKFALMYVLTGSPSSAFNCTIVAGFGLMLRYLRGCTTRTLGEHTRRMRWKRITRGGAKISPVAWNNGVNQRAIRLKQRQVFKIKGALW